MSDSDHLAGGEPTDEPRPAVPPPPTIGDRSETGRPARVGPPSGPSPQDPQAGPRVGEQPDIVPGPPEEQPADESDFEIALGPLQTVEYEQRTAPDAQRRLACMQCGRPDSREPRIFISMQAMAKIEAHGRTDLSKEIGGVMMGECGRDEKGLFVEVLDAIPADHVEHSSAQITFTHNSWPDIDRKQAEQCPDLKRVGWYHTHPGFGVFLSHMDVFIHKHFFNQPGNIAYVYDPVGRRRAFFRWSGKKIQSAGGFMIFGSRKETRQLEQHMQRLAAEAAPPGAMGGVADLSSRLLDQLFLLQRQARWVAIGQFVLAAILVVLMFWSMLRIGGLANKVQQLSNDLVAVQRRGEPLRIAENLKKIRENAEAEKYYKIAALSPSTRKLAVERLTMLYDRTGQTAEAQRYIKEAYRASPTTFAQFFRNCLFDWLGGSDDPSVQRPLVAMIPDDLVKVMIDRLRERSSLADVVAIDLLMERPKTAFQETAHRALVEIGRAQHVDKTIRDPAAQAAEAYINTKIDAAVKLHASDASRAKDEMRRLIGLDPDNKTLTDQLKKWETPPTVPTPPPAPGGTGGSSSGGPGGGS